MSLPDRLVTAALEFVLPGISRIPEVHRDLRCPLQEHTNGDHYAYVMHLDGPDTGAVWTHWIPGQEPGEVVVLPDCEVVSPSPSREPCSEFAEHPGDHTYNIADPFAAAPGMHESQ